jgi:hypothetical protein
MAGVIFRPALQEDHAALEALFRETPMGSSIRIGFERDPDCFAGSAVQADEPCVWGVFEPSGRAVGMFGAGWRKVWLNGETRMRYLSDLRIHPEWQATSLLGRGFRVLKREVFQPGEWAQTLVLEDNAKALELLTSRRGGLPRYVPAGRYVTWLLPEQKIGCPPEIHVRKAGADDIGEMQKLLDGASSARSFSRLLSLNDLGTPGWHDLEIGDFLVAERNEKIVGMMGLWDQSGFQRLRVNGYSRSMAALRPCWNLFSKVKLPPAGSVLRLIKATSLACHDDDPLILRAMLATALSRRDGALLLLGMSAEDPLCAGLRNLNGRMYYGRHFLVGWDGDPPDWKEPFAFDVARI